MSDKNNKKTVKGKTISVRLTVENEKILKNENEKGISTSAYINSLVSTNGKSRLFVDSHVLVNFANLQSLLEQSDDPLDKRIREELNELCRYLKS